MGIFDKMREPEFLKESSDIERQLEVLRKLEPNLNQEGKKKIQEDIRSLEYGLLGEKNIAFELKNSHMPMYILHDIYLESGDLSAQIDYLVVTRKMCFIIECKNLYGNIEINQAGDFIRTVEFSGHKKKEGIYSPVTQNQRHLELLRKIKLERKTNLLTRKIAESSFYDFHKAVVVLANPKTILSARYAKKEIKDQVIRADQLVNYIKAVYEKSKELEFSDKQLLAWAQGFLDMHQEIQKNYIMKYDKYRCETPNDGTENSAEDQLSIDPNEVEETDLYKKLKQYRLEKSREEKIKPYYIYNDNQLKDLIDKNPKTKKELLAVSGFGAAKTEKYGDAVLEILRIYGN